MPVPVYSTPADYTPCHYTTAEAVLSDPLVNVTFADVVAMDDAAWHAWLTRVRVAILRQWDAIGVPPRTGLSEAELAQAADRLIADDASKVWTTDDDGAECLSAPSTSGGFVGNWFETMMKTRIVTSTKSEGLSIYDIFANDDLWARYVKSYAVRHFRKDSFYAYSRAIHTHEDLPTRPGVVPVSAEDYLRQLAAHPRVESASLFDDAPTTTYGVWLAPANADEDYNGYSEKMSSGRQIWTMSQEDALRLKDDPTMPAAWFRFVAPDLKKSHYMVRLFDSDTRIFPDGFRSFRISMTNSVVNFPPLVARALYERYGPDHGVYWDPSSGWAGRLAGTITSPKRPLYIGTDPNTDHLWTDADGVAHSKYTELAAYLGQRMPLAERPRVLFFPCGSEVMRDQPKFQAYKGAVDVIGTSCPYLWKEWYSDDPEQSCVKFSEFEGWCDGFLRPTIETAAEWLKPGGYLWWNIADVRFDGKLYPLEQRSMDYAKAAGLEYVTTHRMLLASMPGGNRVINGQGTAKNVTKVRGRITKYEPVYIFRRPLV